MKPTPPQKPQVSQPTAALPPAAADSELQERLFKLLLLPAADPNSDKTADTNLALDQRSDQQRLPRAHAGELTATAYLLAGYVQQLTAAYGGLQPAAAEAAPVARSHDQAVNVRLEASTSGGGLASVELVHPDFGQVGLEIELVNGALRVTATAESERAANAIAQGQAVLIERLREHGVTLEALDVNVVRKRFHRQQGSRTRPRQRNQES